MAVRRLAILTLLLGVTGLVGCASRGTVVDDGRPLDPHLLASFQLYGQGERALRPALARAAPLALQAQTPCDKQWELPLAVATAEGSEGDERLAWKRALNVDDGLSIIAVQPGMQLQEGERIVKVAGRSEDSALRLLERLGEAREAGEPFVLQTAQGKQVRVQPFQVCRGYTRLAPPTTPKTQDYHWLMSLHPLELPQVQPTADEMLWAVLWTQGLSEEGGARMKTLHYTVKIGGTLLQLATLASGLGAAAKAADVALSEAKKQAANVVMDIAKQQVIEQGKQLARQKILEGLQEAAVDVSRGQALALLQRSAANRGGLWGVSMAAATAWDEADAWAFARMQQLGADPLAGLSLHRKMVQQDLAGNAFALDAERLAGLSRLAEQAGLRGALYAVLRGDLGLALDTPMLTMPSASARSAFSFDSAQDPASAGGTFSRGLIEGMLHMPSAGSRR